MLINSSHLAILIRIWLHRFEFSLIFPVRPPRSARQPPQAVVKPFEASEARPRLRNSDRVSSRATLPPERPPPERPRRMHAAQVAHGPRWNPSISDGTWCIFCILPRHFVVTILNELSLLARDRATKRYARVEASDSAISLHSSCVKFESDLPITRTQGIPVVHSGGPIRAPSPITSLENVDLADLDVLDAAASADFRTMWVGRFLASGQCG